MVEADRTLLRARALGTVSEAKLMEAAPSIEALWARCEMWELSRHVCDLARHVAPTTPLRTLDALHLATFLLARRRIPDLELLTVDDRLRKAAGLEADAD